MSKSLPLTDTLGSVRDTIDHIYAYTGPDRDEESDLQYNRARYYDPSVGRWISEDPIGFAAGDSNLARYVGNAPVNFADPTGLVAATDASQGEYTEQHPDEDQGFFGGLVTELYWYGQMLIGRRPDGNGKSEAYPWSPLRRMAEDQSKIPLNPVPMEAIAEASEGNLVPAAKEVIWELGSRGLGKLIPKQLKGRLGFADELGEGAGKRIRPRDAEKLKDLGRRNLDLRRKLADARDKLDELRRDTPTNAIDAIDFDDFKQRRIEALREGIEKIEEEIERNLRGIDDLLPKQ